MFKYIKALPRNKVKGYDILHTTLKDGTHLVSESSIQEVSGYSLCEIIQKIVKEDFAFANELDEMASKMQKAFQSYEKEYENLKKLFEDYDKKRQGIQLKLNNQLWDFQNKIIEEISPAKEKWTF